jgi:hypothetical protein
MRLLLMGAAVLLLVISGELAASYTRIALLMSIVGGGAVGYLTMSKR